MNNQLSFDKLTFRTIIITIWTWFFVGVLISIEYFIFMPIALILTVLFDRKQKRIIFYLTKAFIKIFFFLFFTSDFKIFLKNIKKSKNPRIYILNHASQFDTFLMYLLPGRIKIFVKENYTKVPFIGWTIKLSGNILVKKPSEIYDNSNTIGDGIRELQNGASIVIFPEGTKSKTGEIGRFKLGSFRLAYETKAEIVPVVLDTWNSIRPGGAWIRDVKVWMKSLDPISYDKYKNIEEKDFARFLRNKMSEELLKIREIRKEKEKKYYRNNEIFLNIDKETYAKIEEFKKNNNINI